jgi:hypothetical protein
MIDVKKIPPDIPTKAHQKNFINERENIFIFVFMKPIQAK